MAMVIREVHQLPTLRLRLGTRRDPSSTQPGTESQVGAPTRNVVLSQILHGSDVVSPLVETDASLIGLKPDLTLDDRGSADLSRTAIGGQVTSLLEGGQHDGLLWYHIAQDAPALSLLPWEELLHALTKVPFIRIPNFLNLSFRPSADPVVAICASAPVNDGPYLLAEYVTSVANSIVTAAAATSVRPAIHIFADQDFASLILATVGDLTSSTLPTPLIAHPYHHPDAGPDDPSRDWLDWVASSLGGRAADIVHFIGPGSLERNQGALVLARRPDRNDGSGTFLGCGDLNAFYDRVGCTAMAFSSPLPEWAAGLRALASQLSWLRPGPILCTEGASSELDGLTGAYAALFGGGRDGFRRWAGQGARPLHFCCHPDLLSDEHPARLETSPELHGIASAYLSNLGAALTPTRTLSGSEAAEKVGASAAFDFLSSLVSPSSSSRP